MDEARKTEVKRRSTPAKCDIYEEGGRVVLSLEMPGVNKDNLDIRIDADKLIIDGRRAEAPADAAYLVREIRDCDFHHEFTIDDTIDRNKIDAVIKNGVVTLTLVIKESEKPKKIAVIAK
jgi:HSP20 family protein